MPLAVAGAAAMVCHTDVSILVQFCALALALVDCAFYHTCYGLLLLLLQFWAQPHLGCCLAAATAAASAIFMVTMIVNIGHSIQRPVGPWQCTCH
jgi:succinate dehydrogenase/fumarate reductase cytochrome b subunit